MRETSNKQRDELFNENTQKKLRKMFEIDKRIIQMDNNIKWQLRLYNMILIVNLGCLLYMARYKLG